MIPRILHRVVPEHTSDEAEAFWSAWCAMHPAWGHITWRDPLDPSEWELGHRFAECTAGAQLAGLVRLEAIWRHGGVYVDSDFQPLRPLDDLLRNPCFIGTEDGHFLTDALFGAERSHPGIRSCIDRVATMPMSIGPAGTGPELVTAILTGRPDVTVLAQRMLYPYSFHERWRREGLEPFARTFPDSYAVHHWAFSWDGWDVPGAERQHVRILDAP